MAHTSGLNSKLLTVTEASKDSIDVASNSYHCTNCAAEDFNNVEECLKKMVAMLKLLPQNKCEASKRQIINEIGGVQSVLLVDDDVSIIESVKSGNLNQVKTILRKENVDLEIKDDDGNTALHMAAQLGNRVIVNLLLEAGACIKSKNNELDTPLHTSCQFGHADIISIFLKNKVLINIRNKFDNTPLHVASAHGRANIVELLLKQGADYKIRNKDKFIPYACSSTEYVIQAYNDAKPNNFWKVQENCLLTNAIMKDNYLLVEHFLESGYNINKKIDNDTLMHICAKQDSYYTADLLLTRGAIEEMNLHDFCTPLTYACQYGSEKVAKLLLKHGANINHNIHLNTIPLYKACENGYINIVKLLLSYNAETTFITKGKSCDIALKAAPKNSEIQALISNHRSDNSKLKKRSTCSYLMIVLKILFIFMVVIVLLNVLSNL